MAGNLEGVKVEEKQEKSVPPSAGAARFLTSFPHLSRPFCSSGIRRSAHSLGKLRNASERFEITTISAQ
jgi:hypothetical protein